MAVSKEVDSGQQGGGQWSAGDDQCSGGGWTVVDRGMASVRQGGNGGQQVCGNGQPAGGQLSAGMWQWAAGI